MPTSSPTWPRPPVQATAAPVPWMALSAEPGIVAPGNRVILRLELVNLGGAPLQGASLTLGQPADFSFASVRVSLGNVGMTASEIVWSPGQVEAGSGGLMELVGVVADDVLPDGAIPLRA